MYFFLSSFFVNRFAIKGMPTVIRILPNLVVASACFLGDGEQRAGPAYSEGGGNSAPSDGQGRRPPSPGPWGAGTTPSSEVQQLSLHVSGPGPVQGAGDTREQGHEQPISGDSQTWGDAAAGAPGWRRSLLPQLGGRAPLGPRKPTTHSRCTGRGPGPSRRAKGATAEVPEQGHHGGDTGSGEASMKPREPC